MDRLKALVKDWLLARNYTLIKGNLRQQIKTECTAAVLPQHAVQGAQVFASRFDVLPHLPKGGTIAEIGLGYGDFTQVLLQQLEPVQFIAIDNFGFAAGAEPWGQTHLATSRLSHVQWFCNRFEREINNGLMQVKKGCSWEVVEALQDKSLDFAYVDADHSYAAVHKDATALLPKMKNEGIIQFNDYTFFDYNGLEPFGVPKAVHEFMLHHQYKMIYLCLHPEGFYDVGLQKR